MKHDHEAARRFAEHGVLAIPQIPNFKACYIERDRQYAELRRLAEEFYEAMTALYPTYEEGRQAQEQWSNRRHQAHEDLGNFLERNPK